MLRAISLSYPFLPRLVPDGIFEERTELAVVLFQQNFGLPPTGTVDNDTWDAIASVYRGVVARTRLPRGADVYPSPSFRVEPGGETLHLLVVQSSHMLSQPLFVQGTDLLQQNNRLFFQSAYPEQINVSRHIGFFPLGSDRSHNNGGAMLISDVILNYHDWTIAALFAAAHWLQVCVKQIPSYDFSHGVDLPKI